MRGERARRQEVGPEPCLFPQTPTPLSLPLTCMTLYSCLCYNQYQNNHWMIEYVSKGTNE